MTGGPNEFDMHCLVAYPSELGCDGNSDLCYNASAGHQVSAPAGLGVGVGCRVA